jgi:hypothetical protein
MGSIKPLATNKKSNPDTGRLVPVSRQGVQIKPLQDKWEKPHRVVLGMNTPASMGRQLIE